MPAEATAPVRPPQSDSVVRARAGAAMMEDGGFGSGKGLGRDNRELYRAKARLRKVVQGAVVAGIMVILAAVASWSVVSDLLAH